MPTFLIAQVRRTDLGPAIVEYLQKVDATLEPFRGRVVIHGDPVESVEGAWSGDVIVIEFPGPAEAHGWYDSAAYREIRHLRIDNTDAIFVDGVADGYRCADALVKA
jgi:uncharacterized protein (DUF1330 family)